MVERCGCTNNSWNRRFPIASGCRWERESRSSRGVIPGMHSWKSWGILEVSLIQQLDEETREEQASTTSLRQPTSGRVSFWRGKSQNWNQLVPNQWLWHHSFECSLAELVLKSAGHVPGAHSCVKLCWSLSKRNRSLTRCDVVFTLPLLTESEAVQRSTINYRLSPEVPSLFLGSLDPSVTARQKSDPSVKGLRWRKAKTYKISFYF